MTVTARMDTFTIILVQIINNIHQATFHNLVGSPHQIPLHKTCLFAVNVIIY